MPGQTPNAKDPMETYRALQRAQDPLSRDPAGRFAPKTTTSEAKEAGEGEGEPEAKETTAATEKDRSRALTALQRAKVPKSVIEGLADEALLEWGGELAQDQAQTDRLLRERSPKATEATRPDPEATQASGTPGKAAHRFHELMGFSDEEGSEFEQAVKQIAGGEAQEVERLRAELKSVAQLTGSIYSQVARTRLEERFPELREEEVYRQVKERMTSLAETDSYDKIEGLEDKYLRSMEDAAAIVLKDKLLSKAEKAVKAAARARANSQPTVENLKSSLKAKYTGMDRSRLGYELLKEGYTPEQARALVDEIG